MNQNHPTFHLILAKRDHLDPFKQRLIGFAVVYGDSTAKQDKAIRLQNAKAMELVAGTLKHRVCKWFAFLAISLSNNYKPNVT